MLKLLVVGHARHGKDTFCEYLRDKYGYKFISSSEFCAEHVVFPVLASRYGYKTVQECFDDRSNHRAEWFDIIADYNREDPSRLGREIFATCDIYCGLRNIREMKALKACGTYDHSVWIEAGERVPREDSSSNTIMMADADWLVHNQGSIEDFHQNIDFFMTMLSV